MGDRPFVHTFDRRTEPGRQGGSAGPRAGSIGTMADLTHARIDEIEAIDGFFEGIKFRNAAAGLGVGGSL